MGWLSRLLGREPPPAGHLTPLSPIPPENPHFEGDGEFDFDIVGRATIKTLSQGSLAARRMPPQSMSASRH